MTDNSQVPVTHSDGVPQAVIRTKEQVAFGRMQTRLWWLTGVCTILAAALVVTSFRTQGTQLTIHFQEGHGLKTGDTLRYRGIDIGTVQSVAVSKDLSGVDVIVLLAPGNAAVAVEGSQFWIERPRLRLGQVSGLDTVLGAKYIGVLPGAADAKRLEHFVGIESPLNMTLGDSTEIRIQFPAGEGIAVGDTVRYRGISVGEVVYVELSESIDAVSVGLRLVGAARSLARIGTQFWIERPRLDLTEVRGLETLVAGRYIAIQPTSEKGEPQTEFVGLPEPPPLPRRDGSLEVELDASNRLGLVRGAPITYRGLEVGRVANVGLSRDGATVKVRSVIDAEYAELVRDNSKWWAVGGIKVDANLRGVRVAVDSLSAWIRGGIAFATPESPGRRVVTGHRFVLEAEALPEWLDWQPRIVVGKDRVDGHDLPQPLRVVASWQASLFGLYRRRTAECWAIALDDGTLRVPLAFIESARAAQSEVQIEVSGKSYAFRSEAVQVDGQVASLPLPQDTQVPTWPSNKLGTWQTPSILLVVNPELSEPMALDATRLASLQGVGLEIAPGVPISPTLQGSPVMDAGTGELIGLLIERPKGWAVGQVLH